MTLRETLRTLWNRRAVLISAAIVAVAVGGLLVVVQGVQYEARAQVLMSQSGVLAPGDQGLQTQAKLNLLTFTYAKLAASPVFVDEAMRSQGLARKSSVTVTADPTPNTSVFSIVVHASSSKDAVDAANALQKAIRAEIERPRSDATLAFSSQLIENPSSRRSSAAPLFVVLASLIVGLALGAIVALLLDST
jgi:capsular polysaccharide biosynthesis protein